jgi:tetratricopeptide (TPR) repeat protein
MGACGRCSGGRCSKPERLPGPTPYAHLQVAVNALRPADASPHWWLGQALERAERVEEARQQYEAALRFDPRHGGALLHLGQLAGVSGQLTEAESLFRRAVKAAPGSPQAAAALAEVLLRLGHPAEAAAEARRAVKLAPESVKANFWLARSLHALDIGRYETEAEAAYRKAAAGSTDKAEPRYHLAQLLRQRGRIREAMEELQTTLNENRLHKNSYHELALCARALGERERAAAATRRFRELDRLDLEGSQLEYRVWAEPENRARRLALARFYVKHGRPDLARPQVERILRRNPRDSEARTLAAQIAAHPEPTL